MSRDFGCTIISHHCDNYHILNKCSLLFDHPYSFPDLKLRFVVSFFFPLSASSHFLKQSRTAASVKGYTPHSTCGPGKSFPVILPSFVETLYSLACLLQTHCRAPTISPPNICML